MRYAAVNLTPLLDVLFIILFVIMGQQTEEVKQEIDIRSQKNQQLTLQKQQLDRAVLKAQNQLAKLQQQLQQLKKQKQDMGQHLELEKEKLERSLDKYKKLDDKYKALLKLHSVQKQQLGIERKKIADLNKRLVALRKETKRRELEKNQIQRKLGQKIDQLLAQEQSLLQEKEGLEKANQQLETVLSKIQKQLQQQKQSLDAQIKEKQNLKKQLLKIRKKLQKQLQELTITNKKLEKEIEDLKQDIQSLLQKTDILRQNLEKKTQLLVQKEMAYKGVQKNLKIAKQDKERYQAQAENQAIQNQILTLQYQRMNKMLQGRNLHKTCMKADLLTRNFAVYEVVLRAQGEIVVTLPSGKKHKRIIKHKKEVKLFLGEVLPQVVFFKSQNAIFLVLIEPNSILAHKRWIEEELKKMKVFYATQHLP